MRRPRDRVFGNVIEWRKDPADEIGLRAACRRNCNDGTELAKHQHVRGKCADLGFVFDDNQGVAAVVPQRFDRAGHADGGGDFGQGRRCCHPCRQRQVIAGVGTRDREDSRFARPECYLLASRIGAQDIMPTCERGMTAKGDLGGWRVPTQLVIGGPRCVGHDEGGFGQVVFLRDRQQHLVVEPGIEWHHPGRVARERPAGEGVDLCKGNFHRAPSLANAAGKTPPVST